MNTIAGLVIAILLIAPQLVFAQDYCRIAENVKVPCLFGTTPGAGPAAQQTFGGVVIKVLNILLLVVGSVAVLFLMWGGLRYITAHGSEEQSESAKKTMQHAIWGLVIVLLSFTIIAIITNVLIKGRGGIFGP